MNVVVVVFTPWTNISRLLHFTLLMFVLFCSKSGTKNKFKATRKKSDERIVCECLCTARDTQYRRRCVFLPLYKCVSLSCYTWSRVCDCVTVCMCACVSLQVFSNCSCVGVAGNFTAGAGPCPHTDDCDRMFPYFLALSVITSFIISLGGTPGYMILIRWDLKLLWRFKNKRPLIARPWDIYFIFKLCVVWTCPVCIFNMLIQF